LGGGINPKTPFQLLFGIGGRIQRPRLGARVYYGTLLGPKFGIFPGLKKA